MSNKLKLPEERIFKLGFEVLDYIYGELTIRKGLYWKELFVDKDGNGRLGYDKERPGNLKLLAFLIKDLEFFLAILPIEEIDYERVLKAWFEERYNRKVDYTSWRESNSLP